MVIHCLLPCQMQYVQIDITETVNTSQTHVISVHRYMLYGVLYYTYTCIIIERINQNHVNKTQRLQSNR